MSDREVFEQHVRGLREIPIEELSVEFNVAEMLAIDHYQKSITNIGQLALKPIPEVIAITHGEQAGMLADNTIDYDDEGEDMIVEDEVIRRIIEARRTNGSTEITALFRARRSVVAYLFAHWEAVEERYKQPKAG